MPAVVASIPLLALGWLSGCVVPISPDFKDPPAAQNFPPQLLGDTAVPPFGSETTNIDFRVTVTDPNGGDDLFIRWVSDFPLVSPLTRTLFAPITTVIHRADGAQQFTLLEMKIDCVRDFIPGGIARHQIAVLVGDKDFAPETTDLTRLTDGSHAVYGVWTLDRQCPGNGIP